MTMLKNFSNQSSRERGSALVLTMVLGAIALAILASVMTWSATSAKLTHRSIQYTRSVAAAEGATEKVVAQITHDFLYGGEVRVLNRLPGYRANTVPTTTDSAYWNNWVFDDGNGNLGQTHVRRSPGTSYIVLDSTYAGLKAYVTTYTVVAHARDTANPQEVTGGVLQELQLAGIPIFQFAMYSAGDMEISCGQPFTINGRVHANQTLYTEPDSSLTFESSVTAVVDILFQRAPADTRGSPGGDPPLYLGDKTTPVAALTLPIGTTNTPETIREIIEPPPLGEDPTSPLGRLRYYNNTEVRLVVSDTGYRATAGGYVITNDLLLFVATNKTFFDARENKNVQPVDLNIGNLTAWVKTNAVLRGVLGGATLSSIYVVDNRTLPGNNLNAVRVVNGTDLPPSGLTIATGRPLYVFGDYNQTNTANLGTANTTGTRPASLVADAITILSGNWSDANSTFDVSSRYAAPTTVNAALLTGVVETTPGKYSGGMENFPRFLETWGGANPFTYNGSMVKMFPSLYATNTWGSGNVYTPPARRWAYDLNFDDPTKLPPKTPSLLKVFRNRWATVPPGTNSLAVAP